MTRRPQNENDNRPSPRDLEIAALLIEIDASPLEQGVRDLLKRIATRPHPAAVEDARAALDAACERLERGL